jgi:catechol 1,2-dioxygenase
MRRTRAISRRAFLVGTMGASAIGLLPGCSGPAATAGGRADGGGAATDLSPTPACEETEDQILGPFYRDGAPMRATLTGPGGGEALVVRGVVLGTGAACTPLAGALLDVWHADAGGAYDNTTPDFGWRGRLLTDASGAYTLTTILPGRYLNGDTYRPRHIHLTISADGHAPLTTQLYFEGDPFLKPTPSITRRW